MNDKRAYVCTYFASLTSIINFPVCCFPPATADHPPQLTVTTPQALPELMPLMMWFSILCQLHISGHPSHSMYDNCKKFQWLVKRSVMCRVFLVFKFVRLLSEIYFHGYVTVRKFRFMKHLRLWYKIFSMNIFLWQFHHVTLVRTILE